MGVEPRNIWGKINTEVNGLHFIGEIESEKGDYRAFYENVATSILGETKLEVTATQGANTIKIIELAVKSNVEKRTIDFL